MRPNPKICAVIVCFQPQLPILKGVLASLSGQVATLLVVDNGSDAEVFQWLDAQHQQGALRHMRQPENVGIAAAHNLGIACARQTGHSHVILMDQDSLAARDMIGQLTRTLRELEDQGRKVAAVGPMLLDTGTQSIFPFIKLGILSNQRHPGTVKRDAPIEADIIISSGKLIPLEVIDVVGGMEESLFLDNVDVEWCFRASAHGFRVYGDTNAMMHHTLGDRVVRVWLFRERRVIVHQPTRLYYMLRNRVRLYRRDYTPRLWIVQDWYRLIRKFALFSLLIAPRRRNCAMMWQGLRDGLADVGGRYDPLRKRRGAHVPVANRVDAPVAKTIHRG